MIPYAMTMMLLGYSQKNPNGEFGIHFSEIWEFKICHFTPINSGEKKLLPLEILQICVAPLGNSKVWNKTHGNFLLVFLEHPWNFHMFFSSRPL